MLNILTLYLKFSKSWNVLYSPYSSVNSLINLLFILFFDMSIDIPFDMSIDIPFDMSYLH